MKEGPERRKTSAPSSVSSLKGPSWPFRRTQSLRDYGRSPGKAPTSPSASQFAVARDEPITAALRQQRAAELNRPERAHRRKTSGVDVVASSRGSLALDTLPELPPGVENSDPSQVREVM
jgi:hypothetical protein